jgi:hypothetical protein
MRDNGPSLCANPVKPPPDFATIAEFIKDNKCNERGGKTKEKEYQL